MSVDLATWAKGHKPEAGLAAAGILIGVLALRKKSSASSTALPVTMADTTGTDLYNQLESQIASLSAAGSAPTAGGWAVPTGIIQHGSGFMVPGAAGRVESDSSGNTYSYLTSVQDAQRAVKTGKATYYQPNPGTFVPTKGATLAKGTPQFVKLT